jgi:hypothetical protein
MLHVPNRAKNNSSIGEFWGATKIPNWDWGEDIQDSNKDQSSQDHYKRFLKNTAWLDRRIFNLPVCQQCNLPDPESTGHVGNSFARPR